MKKTLLTILILIFVVSVVYAKHKKHPAVNGKEILSVSLKHGGCYGRCPIYNIDVSNNGTVTYTGLMFVKDSGAYTKDIGVTKVKKLFDQFNTYRVDTCSKVYINRIPDLSSIYYSIVYKDATQTISNANLGPAFLKELTNKIDSMGMVDNTWKKVVINGTKQ